MLATFTWLIRGGNVHRAQVVGMFSQDSSKCRIRPFVFLYVYIMHVTIIYIYSSSRAPHTALVFAALHAKHPDLFVPAHSTFVQTTPAASLKKIVPTLAQVCVNMAEKVC